MPRAVSPPRGRPRGASARLGLLVAMAVLWAASAVAQPTDVGGAGAGANGRDPGAFQIVARTQLAVTRDARGQQVSLRIQLRDDLGRVLAWRPILVNWEGTTRPLVWEGETDASGVATLTHLADEGANTVRVRYPGDAFHDAATVTDTFEVVRPTPALTVAAPPWVLSSDAELRATLTLEPPVGDGVEVAWEASCAPDVGGCVLAGGGCTWLVPLQAPPPGACTITATVPAGPTVAGASATTTVRVLGAVTGQLELVANTGGPLRPPTIQVRGALADEAGPVAGVPVLLLLQPDGTRATAQTDATGTFSTPLVASAAGAGLREVLGGLSADATGLPQPPGAVSGTIQLEATWFDRATWWLSAVAALLVLLGVFGVAARSWASRRAIRRVQRPPAALAPSHAAELPPTSLAPGRTALRFVCADDGRVLVVSLQVVSADGGAPGLAVDAQGWWTWEATDTTPVDVEAAVDGYEGWRGALPRQGAVTVRLRSVRRHVLASFRALVDEANAQGDAPRMRWGGPTTTEIVERLQPRVALLRTRPAAAPLFSEELAARLSRAVADGSPGVALDALEALVEDVAFGPRAYPPGTVAQVVALADRVRAALRASAVAALAVATLLLTSGLTPSAVLAQPQAQPAIQQLADYRVENEDWNGISSIARLLARLSIEVVSSDVVDVSTLGPQDVLVVLHPTSSLPVEGLRRWVRDGGRLVLGDDLGSGDALEAELGVRRREPPTAQSELFQENPALPILRPVGTHPLTDGVTGIVGNHVGALEADGLPLLAWEDGTGVAYDVRLGLGRAVVLADPSIWINLMLPLGDNRVLLQNVARSLCEPGMHGCRWVVVTGDAAIEGTPSATSRRASWSAPVESALASLRDVRLDGPTARLLSLLFTLGALAILLSYLTWSRPRWLQAAGRAMRPATNGDFGASVARWSGRMGDANLLVPAAFLRDSFEQAFYAGLGVPRPQNVESRRAAAQQWVGRFGGPRSARAARRETDRVAALLDEIAALPPAQMVAFSPATLHLSARRLLLLLSGARALLHPMNLEPALDFDPLAPR